MKTYKEKNRIYKAMQALGVSVTEAARAGDVDITNVSRWRRDDYKFKRPGVGLRRFACGMLELDDDEVLKEYYTPYHIEGKSDADALVAYFIDHVPSLAPIQAKIPEPEPEPVPQEARQFIARRHVHTRKHLHMGVRELGKMLHETLDYPSSIPPGSEIVILNDDRYRFISKNTSFMLDFLMKLHLMENLDTRVLLINKKGYTNYIMPPIINLWLVAHLKGFVRSRYFEGNLPDNLLHVASIRDYWSVSLEDCPETKDIPSAETNTEPLHTYKLEELCDEYKDKSKSAAQYHFLENPDGDEVNQKLWRAGKLPTRDLPDFPLPRGDFFTVCRVPGFGIMTKDECAEVLGKDIPPEFPDFLFSNDGSFA